MSQTLGGVSVTFQSIANATLTSGTTFNVSSPLSNINSITLYNYDPGVGPTVSTPTSFQGSTGGIWLEVVTSSGTTVYAADLTNGSQRVGGAQSAEDVWVVDVDPAGTPTYFVLTSGGYVAQSVEQINGSIQLSDLDQLLTEQSGPAAPLGVDLVSASDTGASATDNYTSATTPTLRITLDTAGVGGIPPVAGDSVEVYDGATLLGTVTLQAGDITNGYVDYTSSALAAGTKTFSAVMLDQNSGVSGNSPTLSVTIDDTTPAAPSGIDLLAASDTGTSSTDNITADTTPTLRISLDTSGAAGTHAVAGNVVTVYDGATQLGTVTLTGTDITNGYVDYTSGALVDGSKSFKATITDQAGNTSADSSALSVTINTAVSIADATYTENQGTIVLDSAANLSGNTGVDFTGGYIEFAVTGATTAETLGLSTVSTASTTLGDISVVGTTVYRGTGSGTEVLGSVDSTYNGLNGNALRINFSNAFENGQFDIGANGSTTVSGWTSGVVSRVLLDGVYQIAGQATPDDNTYGSGNTTQDFTSGGNFTPTVALSDYNGGYTGDLAIRLDTGTTSIDQAYGTIRGPYVYSNGTVSLQAGDSLSFAWKALSGGDAYDAYGYIVDVNDGSTITILDSTGTASNQETSWATVNRTIAAGEEGVYRFVFVTGSYDLTGGRLLGAALMIDDVAVVQANPPGAVGDSVLESIARGVTYTNTADDVAGSTRTVTMTGVSGGGSPITVSDTATITITQLNDAPTLTGPAVLSAVLEDATNIAGDTVQNIVGTVFADVDMTFTPPDSMSGIAIVGDASTAGQGAWEYSVDGGTTWQAIGAVSPSAGLLIDTAAKLRFVPVADYNGAPGALSIHAMDSTFAGSYSTSGSRETLNYTGGGGATAFTATAGTLTTSVTSVIDRGAANITTATDTGADDLQTGNRNPVIEFAGEAGLTITVDGPASGNTPLSGSQFDVVYNNGVYTVTLRDANTGVSGNQGFGQFDSTGAATGNAANASDGVYTITAQDPVGGVSTTIAAITINTQAPPPATNVDITTGTDTGANDLLTGSTAPVVQFQAQAGLTVIVRGPDGSDLDPSQYTVSENAGAYTLTFVDASTATGGNQPFGSYANGSATGNPAATSDGTYTIIGTGSNGVEGTLASIEIDTTAPTTTVDVIEISTDTGVSDNDFLTTVGTQTITATLTAGLAAGEKLWGSINGGSTWTDVTSFVSGTNLTWSGQTLAGTSSIRLRIGDEANNYSSTTTQPFTIDQSAPTFAALDITTPTDTGANDLVTGNGLPILTFTSEVGLTVRVRGADGMLLNPDQYAVTFTNGTYTVRLVDADLMTSGSQPFGDFDQSGAATSYAGTNSGDGTFTILGSDPAGNTRIVGTFAVDTDRPTTTLSGIDISNDTGTSASDFVTNAASQTVTATLSAPLAGGEVLYGSVDGGSTWTDITASVSGSNVSWTGVTLAGSSSIQMQVRNTVGLAGPSTVQAYVLDTTAPSTTASGIDISNDTGSSASDFVTNAASQTVTATLSAPLAAGEVLYGSVDGGSTWIDITTSVSGTGVSWTGVTLAGSSSIVLKVTDAAGNDSTSANQAYVLDTTAPSTTASGIDISNDTGTSASDFVTNAASQTVTATLSAPLAAGEVLYGSIDGGSTWIDISGSVSGSDVSWTGVTLAGSSSIMLKVTDAAGNDGTSANQAYVLDTTAPSTTALGIDISNDTGTSASDFVTNAASQTVTATLSAPLAAGEVLYGSIDGGSTWIDISGSVSGSDVSWTGVTLAGSSSIMLKVTDAAGNDGTSANQAYVLDTTSPSTTASGIDISDDTGASASDFVTNVASQTVTATLSAPLAAGEVLYGSLDGGSTWTDITGSVSGSDVSWTGVTLSGSGSIVLKVSDAAGNDGTLANQAYEFDASAPATTLSNLAFSDDTGAPNDFFTSVPVQTISATLSNALGAGELVLGSLDGGATWTDVTAYVSGTDLAWSGATLNSGVNELRLLVTDEAGNDGNMETQTYRLGPQVAVSQGGSNYTEQAEFNTDPNANVDYVWIGSMGTEAVQGTDEDDFLAARAGDDAVNGGGGNDIIDGGTGSNFLTGGAGVDRFFIDARGGNTTWSTITDFDRGAGEEVSLWGWQAGTSRATWVDSDGVSGWTGVTMHADVDGNGGIDTSITWTGLTRSDLPVPMEMSAPDGTALLWFV